MNVVEQKARYEIQLEQYVQTIEIESLVLENLVNNQILPTAFKYQSMLIENVKGLKEIYGDDFSKYAPVAMNVIEKISGLQINWLLLVQHLLKNERRPIA
jgi:glutamine synthetase